MSNVGYATLTIIPSAKGFSSSLNNEVAPAVASSGDKASKGLISSFGGAVGKIGGIVAGAVGIVGGLVGGMAVKGGINKALQLEDATAKLTGLGHSTTAVKSIMDNALASVKGTAFGLGEAAGVSAGAVAAGIKPGQELTRVLKLTADAATIAGTDMASMGSIFNKVAASGKLQGDVIAQLQDAGVPILQMVAKELGVTAAEASKMASDGKVDFETFANAMEHGLGGAALKSGDTTKGALANMKAAFSNFGMALLGGFFPIMKTVFGTIQKMVDSTTAIIKPFATEMGQNFVAKVSPKIVEFGDHFAASMKEVSGGITALVAAFKAGGDDVTSSGLAGALERVGLFARRVHDAFADSFGKLQSLLAPAIGGAMGALGPLLSKLPMVGGLFSGITGPVGLVVGALVSLISTSPALQSALGGGLQSVLSVLGDAVVSLAPFFGNLITVIASLIPTLAAGLVPIITAVANVFVQLIPIIVQMVTTALPPLISIFMAVVPVVGQILTAVAPLISMLGSLLIPIIQALLPVVSTVFGALVPIIQAAMQIVQGVIQVVTGLISGNWRQVWNGILTILSGVWNLIGSLISGAIGLVGSVIGAGLNIVSTLFRTIFSGVLSFLGGVWSGITGGVSGAIGNVIGVFGGLLGKITGALAGAGSALWSVGQNIIQGLIDGIGSMMGAIGRAILSLVPGPIVGVFKDLLGIHSPSRVFRGFGVNIGEGLVLGIQDMHGKVEDSVAALANIPASAAFGSPEVTLGGIQGALAGSGRNAGPATIHQENHFNTPMSEETVAELAARKLLRAGVGR
ncbi:phage tail protein [Arthrobacter sp. B2a2-09]|uniref:phage tail protein n=1 Tax=Arthrobacter sp. B2a2-09 TaxID=2952822 RepID=UPI0022CDA12E|nr:tape measure protein [Arthrobacter sp. B2a2-09]MCZ9884638.1 tape measure protein [Arthrobacter sp. B2a2-09]